MPPITNRQKVALVLALTMTINTTDTKVTKKKKRMWSKRQLLKEEQLNKMSLIKELDNQEFRSCLRMDQYSFDMLLNLVRPHITKRDTVMRQAISAEDRLIVTLKYLALGKDYTELGSSSGISIQLISKMVPETCEAICKVLKKYLQVPETEYEWLEIAKQYQQMWQFDHCVGSVGGRHILITKPKQMASQYHNYKNAFSVVLFVVVGADHELLYVHTGTKGSLSEGSILESSQINEKLIRGEFKLPQASMLPRTKVLAPYVFIGENGLGLNEYILESYTQQKLTHNMKIFNYRLSRANRVVENAFGILASRFRVLGKQILVDIQNVDKIIMASCVLYNYLKRNSSNYITTTCVDYEDIKDGTIKPGQWRKQNALLPLHKYEKQETRDDPAVKETFKDYFNGPGKVDFQDKMLDGLNT